MNNSGTPRTRTEPRRIPGYAMLRLLAVFAFPALRVFFLQVPRFSSLLKKPRYLNSNLIRNRG